MNKINVIGIGFRPLEKKAGDLVLQSDDVLVNSRLSDVFKGYAEYDKVKDRIITHASVYETLDYIRDNYQDRKISLLAAGDPMFYGIGRLVAERFGRDSLEVFPDLSSVQVAFSRVRETSNNALLVSLHGGPDPSKRRKMEYEVGELPALLRKHHTIAVLTDKVNNPEKIAEALNTSAIERHSSLKMYVCEKIGYADERIIEGIPEDIAKGSFEHPNVVIIKSAEAGKCGSSEEKGELPPVFGLRESEIGHSKGLITKDEVRAVTIHKLRLPQAGVLWDIGAGSGSVSIEASRLCPGLRIFALEKNEERVECIEENKSKFCADNIDVVRGEAPGSLEGLPAPDRVFIGGSGGSLNNIVNSISAKMTSGIIVINAVTLETLNDSVQSMEKNGFNVDVCEVSVSRSKMIGRKRQMSALNPIFIITGEKHS